MSNAIGGAGIGMQIGGAIGGAYAAYQAGKTNQKIFAFNQRVAEDQYKQAMERGSELEYRHRLKVSSLVGTQRAGFAGQNISLDDGTALEVQRDTAKWGELDALTIRNNAALEAWGYKMNAINASFQGALQNPVGAATGTLLTGLGNAAGSYYNMNRGNSSTKAVAPNTSAE